MPRAVHVLGPVPPPVHGAARVTGLVIDELRGRGAAVRVTDTGGDDRTVARRLRTMVGGLLGLLLSRRASVYVGGAGDQLLWFQAVVVALARLRGHRAVFHHHSFRYLDRPDAAMRWLTRLGGRRLHHVVLCAGMGERLRDGYPGARHVLVCSNAGLLAPSEARSERGGGPVVLGHLSNLTIEKGLGVVLDALRAAVAAGLDVRLRLGGPATGERERTLIDQAAADLGDRLEVLGRLDRDQVDAFHADIDLFLFPSTYTHEAEPLVVLEAMRAGAPSVAYAVGCLPGLVPSGALVPRDGDLPGTLVALLGSPLEPSRSVTDRFDERRRESLAAHATLIDLLTD